METDYARWFLRIGSLYLVIGIALGMFMGGSGDHTLSPVHAHINLLGFTLMTLFGLCLRAIPEMARNTLALAHFWLFQIGALVLLVSLWLMMAGLVAAATIGPVFPVAELLVLAGVLAFVVNLFRNT